MTKLFEASAPLEHAIYQGDTDAVVGLLDPMDAASRAALRPSVTRCARLITKARYAHADETFAGWGRRVDDDHRKAITTAAVMVGCAKEIADVYLVVDHVISLGRTYGGAALDGLVDEMLEREWRIHDAQRLVESGLISRPDTEAYYIGAMNLITRSRFDDRDIHARMAADPGLREVLLRMLEVEGNSNTSMANIDKYSAKKGASWASTFLDLIERGVYTRTQLIDKCLGVLERGWIQFRSSWFSDFHEKLAPTAEEMKPLASRYLHLLGSRIPPTVSFALDCVKQLDKSGEIDPAALLGALRPVLSSAVKGQVSAALKLADSVVKKDPSLAAEAARAVVPALAHESADVQKQVLQRLAAWKIDEDTRAQLADYASGIAAVNKTAMAALVGESVSQKPPPALQRPRIDSSSRNPLRVEARLRPIDSLDELVDRVAYVFENDTDIDELERAMAALMRFAPFDDVARQRLAPVAKRIGKVRKPVAQQLARLLQFLLQGVREPSVPTVDHSGHANFAQLHLIARVDDLVKCAKRTKPYVPLAEPTHRGGFIDAATFVHRLAAHQAGDIPTSDVDFLVGFMRLALSDGAQTSREVGVLAENHYTLAVRFALGEDVKIKDCAIAAAATRMRRVLAGELRGPYSWRVQTKDYPNGMSYSIVVIEPPTEDGAADPVASLETDAAKLGADEFKHWTRLGTVGGIDEASIHYYASLLPGDLESFFAEGAGVLSRNLDWSEAQWQNKVYLQQMLATHVRFGPMAVLTLALGLAGKEAGQTAVAVDVLTQGIADGRVQPMQLAELMARLLRERQATCARYAKSLGAALRMDVHTAGAVFTVLCATTTARPADPPKDTAALLELLLEVSVAHSLGLPEQTRAAIESLQIGGKGKALRRQLLART